MASTQSSPTTWTRSPALGTSSSGQRTSHWRALLAVRAHRAGLAIAQKNLAPLTRSQRKTVGFDFAVSEECGVWHECSSYRAAYGRHVIEIEYTDNGRQAFARSCRDHGTAWSVVLRDRMLVTPASRHYVYRAC